MRHKVLGTLVVACSMVLVGVTDAKAAPLLQLDIAGGVYDESTETIVATSNPFTLIALATPQGNVSADDILNQTYYVSMAVTPQVGPIGANLGSFTVNGQPVNATIDMLYGTPPVETYEELQGTDSGDLSQHDIYPTYFIEYAFQFSGATVPTYNTATGSTENRQSFINQWVINTSGLNSAFAIHFDLYDTKLRNCSRSDKILTGDPNCLDVDRDSFAPFSKDAQSPPVPEPASMLLLGSGLTAAAIRKWRKKKQSLA